MELRKDHFSLSDAAASRRYFSKFERIIKHVRDVVPLSAERQKLYEPELAIIEGYVGALASTFTALSYKHLMAGRISDALPNELEIDRRDSGFPVFREIMQMSVDAGQVETRLANLPDQTELRKEMVSYILDAQEPPTRLQFAMSQRIYYEALQSRAVFWAQNDPQAQWLGTLQNGRRQYLVHWAVYDSQTNLPVVYLMYLEDSGRDGLPRDQRRWPRMQSHLVAQSISSLTLLTIAKGFDEDFDDLHPKLLRRIHVGPMYSHAFTRQDGPLREVLAEASGKPGLDWALSWGVESLSSARVERVSSGLFSSVDREIFRLDHFTPDSEEIGATNVTRAIILPQRPYQVLKDRNPEGLRQVHKYVVGDGGKVLSNV